MKILQSTDLGNSFKKTKSTPAFPEGDGRAVQNIWSLESGKGKRELWCGVDSNLPRRPSRRVEKRKRRRFLEHTPQRLPEEGKLVHSAAGLDAV